MQELIEITGYVLPVILHKSLQKYKYICQNLVQARKYFATVRKFRAFHK